MSMLSNRNYLGARWRFLGIMLGVLVAFAACTGASQTVEPGPSGGLAAKDNIDSALPMDFPIEVYRGEEILGAMELQFSEVLSKGRPIVLNFFAGLCPPCRAEMPDFQAVSVEYQDEVTIFSLDIGPFVGLGSRQTGKDLVEELGLTYPTGSTAEAGVVRAYRVLGMPTTVFITSDGKVANTWSGFLNRRKMTELIEDLLEREGV